MRMISPVTEDSVDFKEHPGRPITGRVAEIAEEISSNVSDGRVQFKMRLMDDELGNRLFSSRARSAARKVGVGVRVRSTRDGFGEITILSDR